MGNYLPSTKAQRQEMLEAVGLRSLDDLYSELPPGLIIKNGLNIPDGKSEMEVLRQMKKIAEKNTVYSSVFRGAGAYNHYIPAVVNSVVNKETLVTAYTPYQAEMSQGILQSIFEYQTMICELTGMDVSNASVYDGASAAAEAVAMCRERKRTKALISAAAHPDVIETIRTYSWAAGYPVELIPAVNGATDLDKLESMIDDETACVFLAQPNFYGIIEDAERAGELTRQNGAKFIMGINPIASAVLKTPAECGADIAVGEGQPLGMHLSFGGPYLGFMAVTKALMRKLPGRIAGETTDSSNNRVFVLTLQAREQHIRREKSSSNICSNQALCAMTAAAYMSTLGPQGMREVAVQSMSKAHYLASELAKLPGFQLKYKGEFFHEFVTERPSNFDKQQECLKEHGILGGLDLGDGVLWCATEMNTKEEIDFAVNSLKGACS